MGGGGPPHYETLSDKMFKRVHMAISCDFNANEEYFYNSIRNLIRCRKELVDIERFWYLYPRDILMLESIKILVNKVLEFVYYSIYEVSI